VLHARAVNILESRLYQGAAPLRVAACPTQMNPWRWKGIVETSGFFALPSVNLLDDFDPTRSLILDKPDRGPAIDAARATPVFQEFLRFSQFPIWRVWPDSKIENAKRVDAIDLRFGFPTAPAFYARALVDSHGKVIESAFHFR
jgi:hypothetical protein